MSHTSKYYIYNNYFYSSINRIAWQAGTGTGCMSEDSDVGLVEPGLLT